MLKNQKGFLLISIIFIMLLMAVSIFSINYYSVTQIRMASNQIDSVQTGYDLNAIIEQSVWKLTDNLFWRTVVAGEDYTFNGTTYTRIARNANTAPFNYPSDFDDAVTIQVTPKGASQSLQRSFRYYAKKLVGIDIEIEDPRGMYKDSSGNLFIADAKRHKIYRVDVSGDITTFAGTGAAGNSGDGGLATLARLNEPRDVYKSSTGSVYIADAKNHKIRKVDASGNISTFAGTGTAGDSGDGGPATLARLNEPSSIAKGFNLYIADTKNHKIRMVDASGNISTVAGTGAAGYSGDNDPAINAQLNEPLGIYIGILYLYIADSKNHRIRAFKFVNSKIYTAAGTGVGGYSGDGGPAVDANLNEPSDIYFDSSEYLFIADTKNHAIRQVTNYNVISTVAGTGDAGDSGDGAPATLAKLNEPRGILKDASNDLYIADTRNHKIRRVDFGDISTFIGGIGDGDGGAALLARLDEPNGIFKDASENLYIADTMHHRIRMVDTSGNISTVAGTGEPGNVGNEGDLATAVELNEPRGIFKDSSGNLYIADTKNHKIRRVDTSGNIWTFAGTGVAGHAGNEGDLATAVELNEPRGIFKDASGNLYIADTKNHKIRRVDTSGNIWTVAGTGDAGNTGDGGAATSAKLNKPYGIFRDTSGIFYIADTNNHKIRMVDTSGNISTVVGTGSSGDTGDGNLATLATLKAPVDVFVDHNQNIFIVDLDSKRIRVVNAPTVNDPVRKIYTLVGTGASGDGTDLPAVDITLKDPGGITMASSSYGNKRIYISDSGNHKIKVLLLKTVYGL
ncbi:MAG: hypothetical protein KKD21_15810 [Proteobacteria bacterium]|nr:hypothetical protein [Pseudomonadota bacterium]MBU1698481.1 hypothetical protein [Pseudomonadota bacterium]